MLAPVLLVIAAAAVILIVGATVGDDEGEDDGRRGDRERVATSDDGGCEPDAQDAVENGYFVIEPGDDLSTVAARTCVTIDEITELNPELDPQLIQPGNCVDLRVDGCKALAEQ